MAENPTFEAGRRQERLYFLGRFLRLWDAEASLVALGEIKSTLIALGVAESDLDSEPVVALARMVVEREEAFQMIEKISKELGYDEPIRRNQSLSTAMETEILKYLPEKCPGCDEFVGNMYKSDRRSKFRPGSGFNGG